MHPDLVDECMMKTAVWNGRLFYSCRCFSGDTFDKREAEKACQKSRKG